MLFLRVPVKSTATWSVSWNWGDFQRKKEKEFVWRNERREKEEMRGEDNRFKMMMNPNRHQGFLAPFPPPLTQDNTTSPAASGQFDRQDYF